MRQSHDYAEVALGGAIDFAAAPYLERLLHECINAATASLVVDMSQVDLPSAACMRALDKAQASAQDRGVELCLRVRRGFTAYRIALVGLHHRWTFELA